MIKTELDIFNMAKVVMDTYKARFDKAKKKKEERFERLKKNFMPGSPLFVKERDSITPQFQEEVEKARHDLMAEFEEELMRLKAVETAQVATISSETKSMMIVLDHLKDSVISIDEYTVLAQHYGGKSYWVDRALERAALKCAIPDSMVQPPLSTKLEILKTLEENVREYIEKYDGEKKNFFVTSSERYLFSLEERYTNNYSSMRLNSREEAKRAVTKALSEGSSFDRALVLANVLRTSKPDVQQEILAYLDEKDPAALHDPTMKFSGVKQVVDKFRETDGRLLKEAKEIMKKVNSAKTHQDRIGLIWDNFSNYQLRKMVENQIEKTNDEKLKDSYQNMWDIKKEQEQESRANKGE